MTMEAKTSAAAKPKVTRVEVYWHTVKYRTVVLYAVVRDGDRAGGGLPRFPGFFERRVAEVSNARPCRTAEWPTPSSRQARFVNLDGKVQVKKVNSVQWVNADYQVTSIRAI